MYMYKYITDTQYLLHIPLSEELWWVARDIHRLNHMQTQQGEYILAAHQYFRKILVQFS